MQEQIRDEPFRGTQDKDTAWRPMGVWAGKGPGSESGCPGPLAAGRSPASQHHCLPALLPWRQVPLTTRGSLMAAGCPNSVSIFQVTWLRMRT